MPDATDRSGVEPPYRLFVSDDRMILVRFWAAGDVEVALRPEPGATWGPPVWLKEERV